MHPGQPVAPQTHHALYPRTAAWFDQLPVGKLAAFPDCRAHSRLPSAIEREFPRLARLPSLPRPWRLALEGSPFAAEWVPESLLVLQYVLLRDSCFADDATFFAATKQRVKASFLTPALRSMMAMVSPHLLVLGCSTRWGQYHQGTSLQARSTSMHSLQATLRFPPPLYPPLMLEDTRVAMAASIELTHKTADIAMELVEPGHCQLKVNWAAGG